MIVSEPFKSKQKVHPEPTVIDINGRKISGKEIAVIAGPVVETKGDCFRCKGS